MRAALITSFGDIDGLTITDLPAPPSDEGMALIRVEASSVGFADTLTRRGIYPPGLTEAGFVPGGDAVGRIVSVGHSDQHELVGRRVYAFTGMGAHAEFVSCPLENLVMLEDSIDPKIAAAFGVLSIVAKVGIDRGGVGPGKTVLIRGASGGVGLAAVRLALAAGAKVVATASSAERAEYLRSLGVAAVMDRLGNPMAEECANCDIVLDPVGGADMSTFLSMLNPNGIYILLGVAGGLPSSDLGAALLANFFKSITFAALSLRSVPMAEWAKVFAGILHQYAEGKLQVDIDSVITLDQLRQAHLRIEAAQNRGRIVVEF